MAKKIFLRDENNIKILPITRGELILDSSGKQAFRSNEFLATDSQPGLMSPADKQKLETVAGNTVDTELSNTSTNPVQNKVLTQIINSIREKYLKSAVVSGNKVTITDQSNNTVEFVNSTYQIVTNAVDGLVPKYDAVDGTIDAQTTDWVLTNHNGTLGWYKLPVAAFSSSSVQLFIGAKSTSNNNNSNSATTNGNTYLKLFDNSTLKNQYNIKGTGLATVISDDSGTITINVPTSHNQASSDINSLAGYAKATAIAAIATSDSLNTALGKLELKADTTYELVKGAYDGDGTIENLAEILKVLEGISDTETIQAIVGKYLPLTGGMMSGNITFDVNRMIRWHQSDSYSISCPTGNDGAYLLLKAHNGITAKKRLSIYTNAESLPNTNYNLYTDGSLYANSGTFGSVNLGSGDLNFKGADPGDIAWYDADNKEKGRIYYDGTALALRHDAGTTYKILHTGNAYISNGTITINGVSITPLTSIPAHGIHWENFTKRATSSATWGTLTSAKGYTPIFWLDSVNGGGVAFSDYNGQTSMQIDGNYYANEGASLVLHTANYNSYAPTLTGTGASGTWGINISGTAAHATSAAALACNSFDTASQITTAYAQWANNSGCSDVPSMGYAAVLNVGYGNYRWWQIWNSRNDHQLYWRPEKSDASGWADVHILIDNKNIANYLPTVTNYYWANQLITSSAKTDATPTFGNTTINGTLGINTVSPRGTLDVYGTDAAVIIGKTNNNPGVAAARKLRLGLATAGHSGSQYWTFCIDDTTSNSYMQIGYTKDEVGISIRHDGALGIGHNYPYQRLTINGNIAFTSSGIIGTSYSSSDTTMYNNITINSSTNGIQYYSGSWTSGNHVAHNFIVGTGNTTALAIYNSKAINLYGYLTSTSSGTFEGNLSVATSGNASPGDAGLEIREYRRGGSDTNITPYSIMYAPRIGFHWGNRTWANFTYFDGIFQFISHNGASLMPIKTSKVFLNGVDIDYGDSALRVTTTHGSSYFGMMNTSYCHIYTDGPAFYFNKPAYISGNTILHSGNSSVSLSGQTLTVKINGVEKSLTNTNTWYGDGLWAPSTNVTLNASANNQEWSFDIYRNSKTGCYWHVWDSSLNTMLKVNADDGKVSAPYGFVGNLTGNATYANSAGYTTRLYANSTGDLLTYPGDYSLSYSRFQSNASNIFPVSNNANGCITAHLHSGDYYAQIGLSSNGRMYYRTMMAQALSAGVGWNTVAWTSDIPTKTSQLTNDSGFITGSYLPLAGGTMTGTPYINMPASAASISDNQPFGITYGKIQCYGTLNIAADTDGSTTEYVIITAGRGMSSATAANGLAIGYSTLKWKGTDISLSGHTHSYLTFYGEGSVANTRTAAYTNAVCAGGWASSSAGYGSTYGTTLDVSGYSTWYNRLAFRTDGRIEYWQGINTTTLGKVGNIAFTWDIPTVTNYYWANIKVSASSSTSTQPTFNTCYTSNWFRSTGATGWYNETYTGGIYMEDSTWVRIYNGKKFYVSNSSSDAIHSAGGVYVAGAVHAYANYLKSTCNSCTVTIGSQNSSYCHYETTAPQHWFNKTVRVQGDVYGGSGYNRRLAYCDEIYAYALPYNGWWSSGSGQNVDNANGMTFVYGNHGSPNGWGILCTFDYQYNSSYKFQLFAEGYSAAGMYYRCRSSDRGGWTGWKTVIDSGNIGSQSVNYATYSRYVYCTSGSYLNFQWSGQGGQPTWLFGSNDGANVYVWNPSNFSVNYANSAGSATKATQDGNGNTISSYYVTLSTDQTITGKKTFSNVILFSGNDSYGIRTATNNYVRIGESSYRFYQCYVSSYYATSGFYQDSDIRLKNIVQNVEVNLDDLAKLQKVYYTWKSGIDTNKHIGMIAQEVQKLYPELVNTDEETGYLSLSYDQLSVIALKAIDKLYAMIKDIQSENKHLKERLNQLENRIS